VKTCPKCNELNGESRTECWKCKASLGAVDTYKKICPKCGLIFSQKAESCDKCGGRLSVSSEGKGYETQNSDSSGCWMYIVSIIIPLVGIILGCIYISRREDELGKSLIITGVISNVITIMLGILLSSCSAF
jgi:ribosomal protein L40E